jgi:hypothetical protein
MVMDVFDKLAFNHHHYFQHGVWTDGQTDQVQYFNTYEDAAQTLRDYGYIVKKGKPWN